MSPAGNSRRRGRTITDRPGVRRASVDYGPNRRPSKRRGGSSGGMKMSGPRRSPIQWAAGLRGMSWQPRKGWFHLLAVLLSWVCVLAIFACVVIIQVGGTATTLAVAGGVAGASGAASAYSVRKSCGPPIRTDSDRAQRIRGTGPRREPTPDTVRVRSHRAGGHGVSTHERRAPGRGGAPRKGGVNSGATGGQRRGGRPA